MAFFCFILFFVLSYLVSLQLALNESSFIHPDCPAFECGNLGLIRFPFNNESLLDCGLYTVRNCKTQPQIQLRRGGVWFGVASISQANVILIDDQDLKNRIDSRNCSILADLALPETASSSLYTADNITLYNCRDKPKDATSLFLSSFNCSGYYTYPNSSGPSNCFNSKVLKIPVNPVGSQNPIIEFTYKFHLQVTIARRCYECYYGGGQCLTTPEGNFNCKNGKTITEGI